MHELFLLTTSTRAYIGSVADIAPRWRLDIGKAFSVLCLASTGKTLKTAHPIPEEKLPVPVRKTSFKSETAG
jgi:hypothetical protein